MASTLLPGIARRLTVPGCYDHRGFLNKLQIYDIVGRTWRLGAPIPVPFEWSSELRGLALDGKFFVMHTYFMSRRVTGMLVYDPESVRGPSNRGSRGEKSVCACCTPASTAAAWLSSQSAGCSSAPPTARGLPPKIAGPKSAGVSYLLLSASPSSSAS